MQTEASKPKYANTTRPTVPSDEEDARLLMARNPQLFNITLVGNKYERYFEVMLGYWLTNANQSLTSDDYHTYGALLGGSMDPTDPSEMPNYQGQRVTSCTSY